MNKPTTIDKEYLQFLVKELLQKNNKLNLSEIDFSGRDIYFTSESGKSASDLSKGWSAILNDVWDSITGNTSKFVQDSSIFLLRNNNDFLAAIENFDTQDIDANTIGNFYRIFNRRCLGEKVEGLGTGGVRGGGRGEGTAEDGGLGSVSVMMIQDPQSYCVDPKVVNTVKRFIAGDKRRREFWEKINSPGDSLRDSGGRVREIFQEEWEKFVDSLEGNVSVDYVIYYYTNPTGDEPGTELTNVSSDKQDQIYGMVSSKDSSMLIAKEMGISQNAAQYYLTNIQKIYTNRRKKASERGSLGNLIYNTKNYWLETEKEEIQKLEKKFIRKAGFRGRDWLDTISGRAKAQSISRSNNAKGLGDYYSKWEFVTRTPGASYTSYDTEVQKAIGVFPEFKKRKIQGKKQWRVRIPRNRGGRRAGEAKRGEIITEIMLVLYGKNPKKPRFFNIPEYYSELKIKKDVYSKMFEFAKAISKKPDFSSVNEQEVKKSNRMKSHPMPGEEYNPYKKQDQELSKMAQSLIGDLRDYTDKIPPEDIPLLHWQMRTDREKLELASKLQKEKYFQKIEQDRQSMIKLFKEKGVTLEKLLPKFDNVIEVTTDSPKSNFMNHLMRQGWHEGIKEKTEENPEGFPDWCPLDCFPLFIDGVLENIYMDMQMQADDDTFDPNNLGSKASVMSKISFSSFLEKDPGFLIKVASEHRSLGTEKFLNKYCKVPFIRRLNGDNRLFHKWKTFSLMMNFDPENRKGTAFWGKLAQEDLGSKREDGLENFATTNLITSMLLNVVADESAYIFAKIGTGVGGLAAGTAGLSAGAIAAGVAFGLGVAFLAFVFWDPFGWFTKKDELDAAVTNIANALNEINTIGNLGLQGIKVSKNIAKSALDKTASNISVDPQDKEPQSSKPSKKIQENTNDAPMSKEAIDSINEQILEQIKIIAKETKDIVKHLDELALSSAQRSMHFSAYSVQEIISMQRNTEKVMKQVLLLPDALLEKSEELKALGKVIISPEDLRACMLLLQGIQSMISNERVSREMLDDFKDSLALENKEPKLNIWFDGEVEDLLIEQVSNAAKATAKAKAQCTENNKDHQKDRELALKNPNTDQSEKDKWIEGKGGTKYSKYGYVFFNGVCYNTLDKDGYKNWLSSFQKVQTTSTTNITPDSGGSSGGSISTSAAASIVQNLMNFHLFYKDNPEVNSKISTQLIKLSKEINLLSKQAKGAAVNAYQNFSQDNGRFSKAWTSTAQSGQATSREEFENKKAQALLSLSPLVGELGKLLKKQKRRIIQNRDKKFTNRHFTVINMDHLASDEYFKNRFYDDLRYVFTNNETRASAAFYANVSKSTGITQRTRDSKKRKYKEPNQTKIFNTYFKIISILMKLRKEDPSFIIDKVTAQENGSQSKVFRHRSGLLNGTDIGGDIQGTGLWAANRRKGIKTVSTFYIYRGSEKNPLLEIGNRANRNKSLIELLAKQFVYNNRPELQVQENKIFKGTEASGNPIKHLIAYSESAAFKQAVKYYKDLQNKASSASKKKAAAGGGIGASTSNILSFSANFKISEDSVRIMLAGHIAFVESLSKLLNIILKIDQAVSKKLYELTDDGPGEDIEKRKIGALKLFSIKHGCLEQLIRTDELLYANGIQMHRFLKNFYDLKSKQ